MKVGDLVKEAGYLDPLALDRAAHRAASTDPHAASDYLGIVVALSVIELQDEPPVVHARVHWGGHRAFWHTTEDLEVINESR